MKKCRFLWFVSFGQAKEMDRYDELLFQDLNFMLGVSLEL